MNSSLSNETLKKLFSYSVGVFCHSTFKNKSMLTRAHFSGHSDDSRSDCIIIMVSIVITVQHIKRAWINPDFNFSLLYTKTWQNKTNKQTQKTLWGCYLSNKNGCILSVNKSTSVCSALCWKNNVLMWFLRNYCMVRNIKAQHCF